MKRNYDHKTIETKWQKHWQENGLYRVEENKNKPKYYVLDMFPYPSGDGLHVGHPRGYLATDIVARYQRMQGKNVLHPMGFDAFGLPAENAAIKKGIDPEKNTESNIANFKRQLNLFGMSYDWDRELNSSHPDYYRWTQWMFLLMHKRDLAYQATGLQWW